MKHMQKQRLHNHTYRHLTALLFTSLALCLVLLSACSTTSAQKASVSAPAPIKMPAISPSLQNQGTMQLQTFSQWIALMQQYGGNVDPYQRQYASDQQALLSATTGVDYQKALGTLSTHVSSIELPAMKAEAQKLQQALQQDASHWGQQHTYYNAYNNTTYPLGFEYGPTGIGGWVQDEMNQAKTFADYQQVIEDLNMFQTHFQAMTANSGDSTPYNQPHKTDLQLIQSYNKMSDRVLIVSLAEEVMRVYDHGKVVNAFLVTTGQPDLPTPPGKWWVESRQTHITFKSIAPPGSPYWYPNTPINYAMQYHSNGYFLHDSYWRNDYGPHTEFPHIDSSGNSSSTQGSHGCVNMTTANAAWVYNFVQLFTTIIVY